jgi:hypothetical protein
VKLDSGALWRVLGLKAMESLRQHLAGLEPGPIDKERLLEVLMPAWASLEGSSEEAMHAGKLSRLEDPYWAPPLLRFSTERHGATVLDSTDAELQSWIVDVDAGSATIGSAGRRKLRKAAPRLDVKSIARELAGVIRTGADDPRVERKADGSVKVLTREFLPAAVKQTMEGRRSRFYETLDAELAPGFVRSGATYRNPSS